MGSDNVFQGANEAGQVALVIIDMQRDFCSEGGWVDQLGEDGSNLRSVIEPIQRLLFAARSFGLPVFFTREGHEPGLSDLNENKRWRTRKHGIGIGDKSKCGRVLVVGEWGWNIIDELQVQEIDHLVNKPGKSAFWQTDFNNRLIRENVDTLIVCGVTTDCCVQSTVRDAVDRGYACAVVGDAVAAVDDDNHIAALDMLVNGSAKIAVKFDTEEIIRMLHEQ